MAIDIATIESLQNNEITLLDGDIQPGLELAFFQGVVFAASKHLIIGDISSSMLDACSHLFSNPILESITIRNLNEKLDPQLFKALQDRSSKLSLFFENPIRPSLETNLQLLTNHHITVRISLDNHWSVQTGSIIKTNDENSKKPYLFTAYNMFYQGKIAISILLCNKEISKLRMNKEILKIAAQIEDQKILFAKIINFSVQNIELEIGDRLLTEVIGNYFNGPVPDYLDYETNPYLTVNLRRLNQNAREELTTVLTHEGIVLCRSPFDKTLLKKSWMRDSMISMGNAKFLVHADSLTLTSGQAVDESCKLDPRNPYGKVSLLHDENMGHSVYDNQEFLDVFAILNHQEIAIQESDVLVEGGNILTFKKNGQKKVIMGRTSLNITAQFRAQLRYTNQDIVQQQNQNTSKNPVSSNYYATLQAMNVSIRKGNLKESKHAAVQALNIHQDQLVLVPNFWYHIDLGMMVMDGYVLLVNLQMGVDIMKKIPSASAQAIAKATEEVNIEYGKYFAIAKQNLLENNIPVVDLPIFFMRDQNNQMICVANFMNGYSGKGEQGNFYITIVPACTQVPIQIPDANDGTFTPVIDELTEAAIFRETEQVLHQQGVDHIYFIGDTGLSYQLINIFEGSLRCLSQRSTPLSPLEYTKSNEPCFMDLSADEVDSAAEDNESKIASDEDAAFSPSPANSSQVEAQENDNHCGSTAVYLTDNSSTLFQQQSAQDMERDVHAVQPPVSSDCAEDNNVQMPDLIKRKEKNDTFFYHNNKKPKIARSEFDSLGPDASIT